MRIKRLEIIEFAMFKDKIIDLDDSINILSGANESGKTTTALFIRCMLFGLGRGKKKETSNIRERIIPFGKSYAKGAMIIEVDGVIYRIERYFARTPKEDYCNVFNEETRERILFIKEPGDHFLGISEATFLRMNYIDELGPEFTSLGNDEIIEKLRDYAMAGQEGISLGKGIDLIEGRIKEISNHRQTGDLNLLKNRQEILAQEVEKLGPLRGDLEEEKEGKKRLLYEINQLIKEKELNEKARKDKDRLRSLDNYEEASYLIKRKEEILSRINRYGNLDKERLVNFIDDVEALSEEIKDINDKVFEFNGALRDLNIKKKTLEEIDSSAFSKETSDLLESYSLSYIKNLRKINLLNTLSMDDNSLEGNLTKAYKGSMKRKFFLEKPLILALPILIALLVPLITFILSRDRLKLSLLISLFFLITVFLLRQVILLKEEVNIEAILDQLKLISPLNTEGDEFFDGEEEGIKEILEEFWREDSSNKLLVYRDREEELEEGIKSILMMAKVEDLGQYREKKAYFDSLWKEKDEIEVNLISFKRNLEDLIRDKDIKIKELESKYKNEIFQLKIESIFPWNKEKDEKFKDLYERSLSQEELLKDFLEIEEKLKGLSLEVNLNDLILNPEAYSKENIIEERIKEEDYIKRMETIQEAILSKRDALSYREGKIGAIEEKINEVYLAAGEMNETKERVRDLTIELKALEMAREAIKKLLEKMEREYLPEVSRKLSKFMDEITGGKYENLFFKDDFSLLMEVEGETKDHGLMSKGTRDLLWLGLRITLCDIINDGKDYPLILDDSLLHLDDERLRNVLSYLKDQGKRIQCIIFSCQNREEEILKSLSY